MTLFRRDKRRSPDGTCGGFEDGMDGLVVHANHCAHAGRSWLQGSDCIGFSTWRGRWPEWARQ